MPTPTDRESPALPPATPEAVAVVEAGLRGGWWQSTLAMAVPAVLAVLIGYVVLLEVRDGDWLAVLFPGFIPLLCAALAVWLMAQAIRTKAAERRLAPADRAQAVYVRGLTGTHRIAANQDPDALATLDRIWERASGRVVSVRRIRTHRTWQAVRELRELDVRANGRVVTALLTVQPGKGPKVGAAVRLLVDPHHPRAVVDLRPARPRRGATT